ncbi:peptide ABC transporter substrate-binding protein [Glycocaulis profundi]|nr:peptide ABC transporter substrate-binding protein [Glycocaulis profundi]
MTLPDLSRRAFIAAASAAGVSACGRREADPEGMLRVAIDTEPDSLDPLKGQFAASALLYKQLHAPLTEYSPSGGLAPGLAASWRTQDGTVWIFRITPGLRWSDGAPLNAHDVVWTARRAVDPATGFANLGDFFAVQGARDALAGRIAPEDIGVEAPDDLTVIFRMSQPVGAFPVLMREFYPLPRHAVEASPDRWTRAENWVGAGPYVLTQSTQLSWRLARNPHFHAADTVSIPNVSVEVVEDPATRTRMFRAGDLDLADQPPAEQIGFLQSQLGERLRAFRAPILTYLKVNHRREGLSDPRVRRALSMAVDRDFLAREFFSGEAGPALSVIPPDPEAERPEGAARPNTEGARLLLEEAGFGPDNPLSLTLRATAGGRERLAVSLADDFAQAGVRTEIIATYPVDMYQAVAGGEYDLALGRFDRGLKSEEDFMLEPFAPGGFADDHGWTGPERDRFAALMAAARAEIGREDRARRHREAEAVFLSEQVNIPLLHERAFWMVSERVRGMPSGLQPQLWRDLRLETR